MPPKCVVRRKGAHRRQNQLGPKCNTHLKVSLSSLLSSSTLNVKPLFYVCQVDTFLRDNLDWMGRASNWAKFTATASIGVVHRGHMKESMNLLQPYLPQGGVSALPYSEGGALYALGLIHSNKGSDGNAQVCLDYFELRMSDETNLLARII